MKLEEQSLPSSWVTVGAFDGVHRGHQALLRDFVEQAHLHEQPAVVLTFFPLPAVFLNRITTPYYLSSPEERAELLKRNGVDEVITLDFDETLRSTSAEEFLIHAKKFLGVRELWAGENFMFGKDRLTPVSELCTLTARQGIELRVRGSQKIGDEVFSSSGIRLQIQHGDVRKAAQWLGRLYRVDGRIVHGEGRGKKLGLPTANIQYWQSKLLPGNGIYAAWLWWRRSRFPCVTNVGIRPTFNEDAQVTIEPYILDFDQDLYGQHVTLEFIEFLRSEERFPTEEALVLQVKDDIQKAREVFKNAPKTPGLPA